MFPDTVRCSVQGIAMVLDILKDAGVTVQASTDTSQILRQLHLELKRNVNAEHSGKIIGKLKKKTKVQVGKIICPKKCSR